MTLCNYKSEIPPETVAAYEEIERTRQSLMRGEATAKTLAYARFLSAAETDATLSHGSFGGFRHNDADVRRRFPFLSDGGGPVLTGRVTSTQSLPSEEK